MQAIQNIGFNVRGELFATIIPPINVSTYKKLLAEYSDSPVELYIRLNEKEMYLFFDTVHLIKNIRNTLLTRKRFLFHSFYFNDLYDNVHVAGGEKSWRLIHKVYEEDQQLLANLKAALKLTASVLHSGNFPFISVCCDQ